MKTCRNGNKTDTNYASLFPIEGSYVRKTSVLSIVDTDILEWTNKHRIISLDFLISFESPQSVIYKKALAKRLITQRNQQPPRRAEYLLRFLPISHKDREAVIGDLEEEYHDICQQFGQKHALHWYWYQVIVSFWPFFKAAIKSIIKWSAIGWLPTVLRLGWEYIRRFV